MDSFGYFFGYLERIVAYMDIFGYLFGYELKHRHS